MQRKLTGNEWQIVQNALQVARQRYLEHAAELAGLAGLERTASPSEPGAYAKLQEQFQRQASECTALLAEIEG